MEGVGEVQKDLISNMEFEKKNEDSKERIKLLERTLNQLASENERLRRELKRANEDANEYKNMYLDKVFGGDK